MQTNHSAILFSDSNLGLRARARSGVARVAVLGLAFGVSTFLLGGSASVAESPLSWVVLTLFARITGVG